MVSQANPDGGVIRTIYNSNGTAHSIVNAMEKTTYFLYDGLNRLTEQWTPFENGRYTYKSIIYDKNGNKIIEKTGKEAVSSYDLPDSFIITSYDYDDNNRLVTVTNSAGSKVEFVYDVNGNINKETAYINATDTKITEYEYNHLGKVTKTHQYVEAKDIYGSLSDPSAVIMLTTTNTYDANGNVKTILTPDGVLTAFEYDYLNRLIYKSYQGKDEYENSVTIKNLQTYDFAGNVLTSTDSNNNTTQNIYNQRGLLIRTIDPKRATTAYFYDKAGRLTAKVLPESYVEGASLTEMERQLYTYDTMNRVILQQDIYKDEATSTFRTINAKAYSYNLNGNVIKELDALGYASGSGVTINERIMSGYGMIYDYNDAGLLLTNLSPVSRDNGESFDVKYLYDAAGRKVSEINAAGHMKKYYYDDAGRLEKTTLVDGVERMLGQSTYDGLGNVLTQTDSNGNVTIYTYNRLGLLRSKKTPGDVSIASNILIISYDAMGREVHQKDSMGRISIFTYDHEGRVLTQSRMKNDGSQNIIISKLYDKAGNLRFSTDGNEVTTEYVYDSLNRLNQTIITVSGIKKVTTNSYDKNGNLLSETDWLGNTYSNTYDALNRIVKKTDPYEIIIERYEYNDNHAQVKSIDALGNETTFIYDKNNRLLNTIDPEGHETSQTYDRVGNIETKTDGNTNVTSFGYDALNRLTSVQNTKGEVTSYTYDLEGNMLTQTDGRENTTSFSYNAVNLMVNKSASESGLEEGKIERYTYYPDGTLKTRRDRNGNLFIFEYDAHGRLVSEKVDSSFTTYSYDDNGNMLNMNDDTGTTTRTYDELGRVLTKTVPNVGTITYTYDITKGQDEGCSMEKSVDPAGNVTYKVYDKAGRLSKVIVGDDTTSYTYYNNGTRKSITYSNGCREEYTYYANNKIKTLVNRNVDLKVMDSYSYTYDDADNQLTKHEIINGIEKGTTTYTYDVLNRIYTIEEPQGRITTYTYDEAGNRDTENIIYKDSADNIVQEVNTYEYDKQNRLTDITTSVNNEIIKQTTYTYDYNGNQLITDVKAYTNGIVTSDISVVINSYDKHNQLIKTVTDDGTQVSNSYNAEGYRVYKEVITKGDDGEDRAQTYYLYEYDKVILEVDKEGSETARNVFGTNLLLRSVEGISYYYMYNGHADVTALVTTDGIIAASYYYDAFGNIIETSGDVNNNILYSGYQYDEETGLYYLNARMYDPKIARFLQEDTYRGAQNDPLSLNLYTYCVNNPFMYWDPTGHNLVNMDTVWEDESYYKYNGCELRKYLKTDEYSGVADAYKPDWTKINSDYWNRTDGYFSGLWWQDFDKLEESISVIRHEIDVFGPMPINNLGYRYDEYNPRMYAMQRVINATRTGEYDTETLRKLEANLSLEGIDYSQADHKIGIKEMDALVSIHSNFKSSKFGDMLESGGGLVVDGLLVLAAGVIYTYGYSNSYNNDYYDDELAISNKVEPNAKGGSQADVLAKNRANGRAFEEAKMPEFSSGVNNAVEQVTIKTNQGTKIRVDAIGIDKNTGNVIINEFKSSATAPLTKNQIKGFPELQKSGGVVVGKGKGIFTGGYQIPPTKVEIIRPNN